MLSLLFYLDNSQTRWVKFVILNAERDLEYRTRVKEVIKEKLSTILPIRMLDIINVPEQWYSKLDDHCKLARNFGESLQRVYWRSKQAIDTTYLMNYCKDKGEYYLHLEDDTPPIRPWLGDILKSIEDINKQEWGALSFWASNRTTIDHSEMRDQLSGFTAILTKPDLLSKFIPYALDRFDEQPIDSLFGSFLIRENLKLFAAHPTNLFIHKGTLSSNKSYIRESLTWEDCDKQ